MGINVLSDAARIGVDLGGTKIEAALVSEEGRVLIRSRMPTPQGDYQGTLQAIVELVTAVESEAGVSGATVGICTPGSLSPTSGLVRNANSTCLNGRPLQQDLESLMGRELRLANDADCLAVSEARNGAAAGARSAFGVILGTGVGGGVMVNGSLLRGVNAISGEWGHNPLPWPTRGEYPGPLCWCGRDGCIEAWLSGPALSEQYRALQNMESGEPLSAGQIAEAASVGEPLAQRAMNAYYERLAKALATVINLLDPEVIVLGGGVSNIPSLYTAVPPLWSKWVFSDAVATRLLPAKYGDASGVRGAAWLWS